MPKSVGFWLYGAQPITTRPPVGRVRFVRWTRNGHGFLKNSKVGRILTVWGPAYYSPAASRPCPFCPLDTERTRIGRIFIRSVSVGRVRFVRFVRWTRNGHGFLKNSKVGRIFIRSVCRSAVSVLSVLSVGHGRPTWFKIVLVQGLIVVTRFSMWACFSLSVVSARHCGHCWQCDWRPGCNRLGPIQSICIVYVLVLVSVCE